jgi:predicted transcriptional regulator
METNMNIQTAKLDLIEWISRLNDSSVIEKLRQLKEDYSKSKDWRDNMKQEEIESINRGLKDFEQGRTHSHEAARKIYEKYL